MDKGQSPPQMFKLITATVDSEWLNAKRVDKYDFLNSAQDKGCKVLLRNSSISIECSFQQLQELYRSYDNDDDDRDDGDVDDVNDPAVREAQDVAKIEQQPGQFGTNSVTDKIILDGYLWDYMVQVYGEEISLMKQKYDMSVKTDEARDGLVTVTLKPKNLIIPVDVMAIQERILEMREYIYTLQSFVLSTVSVESVVTGRLERSHFQDISEYLKAKYKDVIVKRTINGFRVIGPVDSCNEIKRRFEKKSLMSEFRPLKNLKMKRPSNEDYLVGRGRNENISSGRFIGDWAAADVGISGEDGRDQRPPPGEDAGISKLSGESKSELELSENADEEEGQVVFIADDNRLINDRQALQVHEIPSDDDDNSHDTEVLESAKSELGTSLGQSMAEEFQPWTNNSETSVFSNLVDLSSSAEYCGTYDPDEHLEITDVTEVELPKKARKKLPKIAYLVDVAPKGPEINAEKPSKERLQFDSDSDYSE